jgi:hypothetical protein
MRIEAHYSDGFTERLLHWELVVNSGKAYLEAGWFRCQTPLRAKFRFDDVPFRSALKSISTMRDTYHPPWEDMESRDLVVRDGETTICHHVYGASFLIAEHPEIGDFFTSGGFSNRLS